MGGTPARDAAGALAVIISAQAGRLEARDGGDDAELTGR